MADTKSGPDIIYTKVDEAPELASGSFLPIIRAFTNPAGISIGRKDISLAGRIIANFPANLTDAQKQPDDLSILGDLVEEARANVIKLPNISASVPQLQGAIQELQDKGYDIPDYPEDPQNDAEQKIQDTYGIVLGSAVNPVLRQGNSDRRAPNAVKAYAKNNPHSMGSWSAKSQTEVTSMKDDDFFANEKSATITDAGVGDARIEFVDEKGTVSVLKAKTAFQKGDVIDATKMSASVLRSFLAAEIEDAKKKGVLFSMHVKATMMKISDPIIFGHTVSVFFKDVYEKHADTFAKLGIAANNGVGDITSKIQSLPADQKAEIEADLKACMAKQPALYMVNSNRGITNLHVPSDVIIDASMPAIIRNGGKAWGPDGKEADTKCVIPDRSYAVIYDETINFCKENGAFDPTTMGSVSNVGLMAQKAEEYGSHPYTFEAPGKGAIRIVNAAGSTLHEHTVAEGDIWRMCQTKDAPVQDWVGLAVRRARATGTPAIFWLDKNRAHDAQLIEKVERYLKDHDTDGLDIQIMAPGEATRFSLKRLKNGEDTISVTGNVLRDYLTDLFPIMELGTSAKMLSVVPLMNGGGMFETGAGGSAPKHVQQLMEEGHLRWDSLGEYAALGASLEHYSEVAGNKQANVLAKTLDQAIEGVLNNNKSPSRKVGELDTRGSHFYLALYWAQALAAQNDDGALKQHFTPISEALTANEAKIVNELVAAQGNSVDLGGYFQPDPEKVSAAMRPSPTLNSIIG
ncbi:MAG: NADP-dependent isocitrate dehydrogenase [Proteobacteria bacterium]|nr:NADP-dependent isocitrate dehydrogenase [Pseudomonadota bacterium]